LRATLFLLSLSRYSVEDESTFFDDTCPQGPMAQQQGVFELFHLLPVERKQTS
jgi:hypothetical protein